jgi:uncharacterized ion transporter superfamily protein YfcC
VALALVSTVFYVFVKTDVSKQKANNIVTDTSTFTISEKDNQAAEQSFLDRMTASQKRIIGIVLAFFSGLMYGECNTPVLYTKQVEKSDNMLDYMFSYYTGN